MDEFIHKLYSELENQLKNLSIEEDNILKRAETAIRVSANSIDKLKEYIINHEFKNELDEIHFFKEIKPRFISSVIFYVNVYNIETHRPNGSIKIKRKYLQVELHKLKSFFDDNLHFYRYYRTGSNYLDHKYFVRGKQDIRLRLDSHYYETDPRFSTSHDFKVSNILANDLLQVYLENELTKLDFQTTSKDNLIPKNMLHWTGSKVALIELLYGL